MVFLIKISKKNCTTLAIYDNYVINVYYNLILDRIRMNNLFNFYTFQIHLFYQNIAINILKLQK